MRPCVRFRLGGLPAFAPDPQPAPAVRAQRPDSLLRTVGRLVRTRRACPEIGWGDWEVLDASGPLLVLRCRWRGGEVLTLHNLGGATEDAAGLVPEGARVLICDDPDGADPAAPLRPHGWRWLRIGGERR